MSNMVNPETFMNMFHNNPIDLFLTYEKTFLAPRIINQVIDLFPTLASGVLPMAIGSLVEILVADVTNKIALPYTKGGYS
jgi:hypothetical protein